MMRLEKFLRGSVPMAALAVSTLLAGCATPVVPTSHTTVILLPDEDGHVGAVTVASASGSQPLSEAFAGVTVGAAASAPSDPKAIGEVSVSRSYADLMRAQPLKPRTFTLNFVLDSTALTEESKALLPAVIAAARERQPTEITVFGHADARGTETHNLKLSADRARAVAALLRKFEPTLQEIEVQWFGDRVPTYPIDPRDPRNRRAEILIL